MQDQISLDALKKKCQIGKELAIVGHPFVDADVVVVYECVNEWGRIPGTWNLKFDSIHLLSREVHSGNQAVSQRKKRSCTLKKL